MVNEYFSGTLLFQVTDLGDFGLPPFLLGLLLPNENRIFLKNTKLYQVQSLAIRLIFTIHVTDGCFDKSRRVTGTGTRRQNARGSFDGRAGLLVRLLHVLAVLIVVFVITTIDDGCVLIIDTRGSYFLYRSLVRVLFVEDLLAGQTDGILVDLRIGLVVLRFVAWRCYLFSRPVHAGPFVGPLLSQRLFVLSES